MRGSWQAAAGLAAPSLARQSTRVWDVHQPRGKKPSAHMCVLVFTGTQPGPGAQAGHPCLSPDRTQHQGQAVPMSPSVLVPRTRLSSFPTLTSQPGRGVCSAPCRDSRCVSQPWRTTSHHLEHLSHRERPGALPQGWQLGSGMQGWGLLMPSRRELEPLSRASVWPRRIDPNWLFFPQFHLNTITSLSHHYLAAPLGNTFFRSPCLPNCPNIIFFKEVRTCSGTRRAWGTQCHSFRRPGRS